MTSNDDNLDFGFDEIPKDVLERLPDPELARHWPQSLVDMLQVIEAEYIEIGLEPRIAQRLAFSTLRILAYYHGGQVFYLAKGDQLDRALRHHPILARKVVRRRAGRDGARGGDQGGRGGPAAAAPPPGGAASGAAQRDGAAERDPQAEALLADQQWRVSAELCVSVL